jgi:asparagine synthetase B (glutamine-hydrolysing)
MLGEADPAGPVLDDVKLAVFVHGMVFGPAGSCAEQPLCVHEARRLVAAVSGKSPSDVPYGLDGDCALGIVDGETGRLTAFSDRVGWRRLYYCAEDGIVVVSTAIRLIMAAIEKKWRLSRRGARIFLADREPRWPLSIIEGIKTLPPVHRLQAEDGRISLSGYWRPVPAAPPASEADCLEMVRGAMELAVRRRARLGRTVLSLSGGWDSTTLAKLASGIGGIDAAITGTLAGAPNDERAYARRIAQRLGLAWSDVLWSPGDVEDAFRRSASLMDRPGYDPTYRLLLAGAASQAGYQVVLDGAGGDECFSEKWASIDRYAYWLPPLRLLSHLHLTEWVLRFLRAVKKGPYSLVHMFAQGCAPRRLNELLDRRLVPEDGAALLGPSILDEVAALAAERAVALDEVRRKAHTAHEWHYYWCLWATPEMYHVDFATSMFSLLPAMPFVDPGVVDALLTCAKRCYLESRQMESRIVGGIPAEHMVPRKTMFLFPRNAFGRDLLAESITAILDDASWHCLGLNTGRLQEYLRMLRGDHPATAAPGGGFTHEAYWRLASLVFYVSANGIAVA